MVIAKPLIANRVPLACRMLSTIDFHDQALLAADQVDDVRPNGLLPNELHSAQRTRAKTVPESLFRNRSRAAKMSR